jgi:hypothetical protein
MQIYSTQKEKEAQVFWLAFWAGFGKATVVCWAVLLFLCVLIGMVGTSPVDFEGIVTGQGIFAVLSAILGYAAGINAVREWRETSPSQQPIHYIIEQPVHYAGEGVFQSGGKASAIEGAAAGSHGGDALGANDSAELSLTQRCDIIFNAPRQLRESS